MHTVFRLGLAFSLFAGLSLMLAACGGGSYSGGAYTSAGNYAPNTPKPVPVPRSKPVRVIPNTRPAAPGMVTVRKGDTVYALSRRYGVSPQAIIAANNLARPYFLEIGQQLRMPVAQTHTVKRGETTYSISRQYGVDLTSLVRLNDIPPPYTIHVGQVLKLPMQTRTPVVGEISRQPAAATPPPPPRSGSGFDWPARGTIISGFGPKGGGVHNDGINIRVPSGSPVKASETGTVVYAGSELKGFGNLLLIRHQGGWVSAYAHNEALLVKRGDQVMRGQVIARAGSTGSVDEPQVHFELRQGSRAVDPLKYLPGG
ncbi:MAG: M23 family metallopeptidase [Alphaproteobacteria bacterium]|nr:M23 family metallopeptidase [Alphaproteobacteria bacterium]